MTAQSRVLLMADSFDTAELLKAAVCPPFARSLGMPIRLAFCGTGFAAAALGAARGGTTIFFAVQEGH